MWSSGGMRTPGECGAPGDEGPGGPGGAGGCGPVRAPLLPSPPPPCGAAGVGRRRRRRGCPARAGLKRHVTGARGCRGPAGAREAAASGGAAPLDGASRRGAGERGTGNTSGTPGPPGPEPRRILVGGFVVSGGGGGTMGRAETRHRAHRRVLRGAPRPRPIGRPRSRFPGTRGAPPRGLRAAGGGGGGPRRHLLPVLGPREGSGGGLDAPAAPGRAPAGPARPSGSRRNFRNFPRRRRGRVSRGRVPGLSRRRRAGWRGPPAMPGRAGETGQGQSPGAAAGTRQSLGVLGLPSVKRQVMASVRGGFGEGWGYPARGSAGPGQRRPQAGGHGEGFREPGMRRVALPGLNTFVFGSWVRDVSAHLVFSLFAGKQLPDGASGVKFPRGWGRRGGGGRSRGTLSCQAPAQAAGTDPGGVSGGAPPASSSSQAGGIPGGALAASSSSRARGVPGGALAASSSSSRAWGKAPVEGEAGEGKHRRKRSKLQGGPTVGHKSQESGREEQRVDSWGERWSWGSC